MTDHALQRLRERAPHLDADAALLSIQTAAANGAEPWAVTVTGERILRLTIGPTLLYALVKRDGAVATVLLPGMDVETATGRVMLPKVGPQLLGPGVYDIPADRYHADPCVAPALSASLAHRIITATPRHAWWDSRRLNPDFDTTDKEHFDIGSAFHEEMTGKGGGVVHCEFPDFKSKAAQAARDQARAEGKTPLSTPQWEKVQRMARLARVQLARVPGGDPFADPETQKEITIIWEADGVLNRLMADCLDHKRRIAWDLKTCAGLAEPEGWVRTGMGHGCDIRQAHYEDGIQSAFGPGWRYVFAPIEKDPPHAMSLLTLSGEAMFMGRKKLETARMLWRRNLSRADEWPAWDLSQIATVDPPAFHAQKWLEREDRELERSTKPKPTEQQKRDSYASQAPDGFMLS